MTATRHQTDRRPIAGGDEVAARWWAQGGQR